ARKAAIASMSGLRPVTAVGGHGEPAGGSRLKTQGSWEPSDREMKPCPPITSRMVSSESDSVSAPEAEKAMTRWGNTGGSGAPFEFTGAPAGGSKKVLSIEITWRGPSPNMKVTPLVNPSEWQP